jgi:hypothetical protein
MATIEVLTSECVQHAVTVLGGENWMRQPFPWPAMSDASSRSATAKQSHDRDLLVSAHAWTVHGEAHLKCFSDPA